MSELVCRQNKIPPCTFHPSISEKKSTPQSLKQNSTPQSLKTKFHPSTKKKIPPPPKKSHPSICKKKFHHPTENSTTKPTTTPTQVHPYLGSQPLPQNGFDLAHHTTSATYCCHRITHTHPLIPYILTLKPCHNLHHRNYFLKSTNHNFRVFFKTVSRTT